MQKRKWHYYNTILKKQGTFFAIVVSKNNLTSKTKKYVLLNNLKKQLARDTKIKKACIYNITEAIPLEVVEYS
jgi:hypothetical protein